MTLIDGTGHKFYAAMADEFRAENELRGVHGNPQWAKKLLAEVYEALARTDNDKLYAALDGVADITAQWMGAIDRRINDEA